MLKLFYHLGITIIQNSQK